MSSSIWQGSQVIQSSANADNTYKAQRFIATEGQTLFTLTSFVYAVGSGSLIVEINGVSQFIGNDFTETANNKVTLVTPAEAGDVVVIRGFIGGTNAVAAEQSATNSYNYSISAQGYAAQSAASYNSILALSPPNLPLSITNGGTGTNTKEAAFLALAPTPTGNAGKVIGTTDGVSYSLVASGTAQGGQTVTGSVTLTNTSPANIIIGQATTVNNYVTLPDATTCATGSVLFTFTNNSSVDYGVKDSTGTKLGWVPTGQTATIGLNSNVVAAGVWTLQNINKLGITANTITAGRNYGYSIILDATRTLFLSVAASIYGVIYDSSTELFGAETLLVAASVESRFAAVKNAANQVALVYATAGSEFCLIVTCTGTSLTPNAAVSISSTAISIGNLTSYSTSVGAGIAIALVGTSLVYAVYDDTSVVYYLRVITIAGTVPTFSLTPLTVGAIGPYAQVDIYPSGSIARIFYKTESFRGKCTPYTVAGTVLTPGTPSNTSGFGSDAFTPTYLNSLNDIIVVHSPDGYGAFKLTGTVEAFAGLALITRDRILQLTGNTFVSWASATGATSLITDTAGTLSASTSATIIPVGSVPVSAVGNIVKFAQVGTSSLRLTYINYGVSPPVVTSDIVYRLNITNGISLNAPGSTSARGVINQRTLSNGTTDAATGSGINTTISFASAVPLVNSSSQLAGQVTQYGQTKNEAWVTLTSVIQRVELAA